ncbi:lipase maturation factor 2-like [Convolutriloba macropyga]|uniref:lipase maturation factor 2-like n=1 Tax=Convolutriloba macropyga TaxID=536237 RepID=UPI003F523FF2
MFALFSFSSRVARGMLVYGSMWFLYFSLVQAGQTFLSFQWDILLLEAGFLAILIAPLNFPSSTVVRVKRHDEVLMFLVRFLLFKLMFMSGVVKLRSYCPTWWDLSALKYHFETQCIPTPLAWFAHSLLPLWFLRLSVVAVYIIEIALPFYLLSPIKAQRKLAIYSIIFLMCTIVLSGNYTFFNLLTIGLCLGSLQDSDYPSILHSSHRSNEFEENETKTSLNSSVTSEPSTLSRLWGATSRALCWFMDIGLFYWTVRLFKLKLNTTSLSVDSSVNFSFDEFQSFVNTSVVVAIFLATVTLLWIVVKNVVSSLMCENGIVWKMWSASQTIFWGCVAFLLLTMSFVPIVQLTDREGESVVPEFADSLYFSLQEYRVSNSYGLFRRMTGVHGRPEVVLEGSASKDGPWKELHFLYKPGNLSSSPPWVAPHQPRLDWQMWFAALSTPDFSTPWFHTFIYRVLKGQPEVVALLDDNANGDLINSTAAKPPPAFIRAVKYKYFFTKGHQSKNWWRREKEQRLYSDPLSLKSQKLMDHLNRYSIKTVTPPKYSPNWPFYRRVLYTLRPQAHTQIHNISGDALVWSLLLPLIAMKLGKVFSPKYPIKLFYL